ncbi:MAG: hypothetical protein ACYDHH_31810, partial [Solirubrobacteraceae bacterium]
THENSGSKLGSPTPTSRAASPQRERAKGSTTCHIHNFAERQQQTTAAYHGTTTTGTADGITPYALKGHELSSGALTLARIGDVVVADDMVLALARAWDAIRARHEDVPRVVLTVGAHSDRGTRVRLGAYRSIGWSPARPAASPELMTARKELHEAMANDDIAGALRASQFAMFEQLQDLVTDAQRLRGEVLITDEGLFRGPADLLATLLHEAAHTLADRRGIKDTSRQGRYHNARFKAIAEELGLQITRDPSIGWSPSTLTAPTAIAYGDTLNELGHALDCWPEQDQPPSRGGLVAGCQCGIWIRDGSCRATRPRAALCGVCGHLLTALPPSPPAPPSPSDEYAQSEEVFHRWLPEAVRRRQADAEHGQLREDDAGGQPFVGR